MSPEFKGLKEGIDELVEGLMSFDQRDDGDYTKEELLKCKAFIVFCHAEFEIYFEKIARRILKEAKARWDTRLIPDRVIATLLAYRQKELPPIPDDPAQPLGRSNLSAIVDAAVLNQTAAIDDNNGIKASNLAKLFCPLGLMEADIESALLIQLNSTGAARGDFVHKPSKVSIRRIRDPIADELAEIKLLLAEIAKFDAHIETIALIGVDAS
ncbi:MAG: HEPN domain-containing protein [Erythrobacter sp.]